MRASASLPVLLLALGCGSVDLGNQARASAASALGCPEEQVTITPLGAYRFRGEGCGRRTSVGCTAAAMEPLCLPEHRDTAGGVQEDGTVVASQAEVEVAVRARLDARAEDILACVGRERVAVRVAYAADGAVLIGLQGALGETAEERCVQDVLAGARLPPPGREGAVVHLLRAPSEGD